MHDKYDREAIAAIITPPGEGGIGAIRIAGEGSHAALRKLFRPHESPYDKYDMFRLYYGYIMDKKTQIIDEVTMVMMPEGKSYTGQEQTEIFCHGGQVVLKKILGRIYAEGIRPAEPGEFTRRAFLSGRIDLARAEAVAELIAAKTDYSYNAARKNLLGEISDKIDDIREKAIQLMAEIEASVDYPEEHLEPSEKQKLIAGATDILEGAKELAVTYKGGKIIREGFKIAIAGRPNAGKSSLFNLLLNQSRAIVAPVPGTTRDYLTEWIDLGGIAVSLTDTAGLRKRSGEIEKAGQEAAREIMEQADLIVWIADISRKKYKSELKSDLSGNLSEDKLLIVSNKIDLIDDVAQKESYDENDNRQEVFLSCKTREGFEKLKKALLDRIKTDMPDLTDRAVVTSERHKQKLDGAIAAFTKVRNLIELNESPEITSFEMRRGIDAIDEITGRIYNEEVLDRIFAQFCIGK